MHAMDPEEWSGWPPAEQLSIRPSQQGFLGPQGVMTKNQLIPKTLPLGFASNVIGAGIRLSRHKLRKGTVAIARIVTAGGWMDRWCTDTRDILLLLLLLLVRSYILILSPCESLGFMRNVYEYTVRSCSMVNEK